MKKLKILIFVLVNLGWFNCTEKYNFKISSDIPQVIIEAFISNKSYEESKLYPAEGRFFYVKLSYLGDIDYTKNQIISEAKVTLVDDQGNKWNYIENLLDKGTYYIYSQNFKAQFGIKYKLNVELKSGEIFESEWQSMPTERTEIGNISFNEVTNYKYIRRNVNEQVLREFNAIDVNIILPVNHNKEKKYYKWTFDPIWIYIDPKAVQGSVNKKCWVTDKTYLKKFALQKDEVGSYKTKLFNIETTGNERIYEYFSVLITQQNISEGYYHFWDDLLAQNEKGGLFDYPPFNLNTNFKAVNNDFKVQGYFSVVTENAYRWVLNINELSYPIVNNLLELCNIPQSPAPLTNPCRSCMDYSTGFPQNKPPEWW